MKCVEGRFCAMIITHYQRLLNYITPDVVHVMEGRVVLLAVLNLLCVWSVKDAELAEELGLRLQRRTLILCPN